MQNAAAVNSKGKTPSISKVGLGARTRRRADLRGYAKTTRRRLLVRELGGLPRGAELGGGAAARASPQPPKRWPGALITYPVDTFPTPCKTR